ncbi:hypothetical protein [Tahibacter caeni]|uniref:hypothetical protein n=1 Tax=Tahibacter caeni TaxID=1453545 RepID=UPI002147389D|nr:hypothetical protein [Tahibacter caeni]
MTEISDDVLRQWLLQRLPDAEAARLEAQLMQDDSLLDRLRDAETDLLDDAARGRLSTAEAQALREHRLADPAQRERLRAARAFARLREDPSGAADEGIGPERPSPAARQASTLCESATARRRPRGALVLAAAAGIIVAIAASVLWLVPAPVAPNAGIATYALLASTSRGNGPATLRIPAAGSAVRLQVEVADSARRYQLFIETGARRQSVAADLQPRESRAYAYIEATVAAGLLTPGRHRLLLVASNGGGEPEQVWDLQVGER